MGVASVIFRNASQLAWSARILRGVDASGQRMRFGFVAAAIAVSCSSFLSVSVSNAGSNFSTWGMLGCTAAIRGFREVVRGAEKRLRRPYANTITTTVTVMLNSQ